MLSHWLNQLMPRASRSSRRASRRAAAKPGHSRPPALETLEDRTLMTTGLATIHPQMVGQQNLLNWSTINYPGDAVNNFNYGGANMTPRGGDLFGFGHGVDGPIAVESLSNGLLRFHEYVNGVGDIYTDFGQAGAYPVVGDWGGWGFDTPGTVRADSNGQLLWSVEGLDGNTYITHYGPNGAIPIVGDWNGRGYDQLGVVENTSNGNLRWELQGQTPFYYGLNGWTPVSGDWSGRGSDGIGVVAPGAVPPYGANDPNQATWLLTTNSHGGQPTEVLQYGAPGWLVATGDWNGSPGSSTANGRLPSMWTSPEATLMGAALTSPTPATRDLTPFKDIMVSFTGIPPAQDAAMRNALNSPATQGQAISSANGLTTLSQPQAVTASSSDALFSFGDPLSQLPSDPVP